MNLDMYSEKVAIATSLICQISGKKHYHEAFGISSDNMLELFVSCMDQVREIERQASAARIADLEAQFSALKAAGGVPPGHALVPLEPTEAQWSGLARDLIFAFRSSWKADEVLEFLSSIRVEPLPQWLTEALPNASNHTISKGTCAVLVYRAMLHDVPAAPQVAEQTKQEPNHG